MAREGQQLKSKSRKCYLVSAVFETHSINMIHVQQNYVDVESQTLTPKGDNSVRDWTEVLVELSFHCQFATLNARGYCDCFNDIKPTKT